MKKIILALLLPVLWMPLLPRVVGADPLPVFDAVTDGETGHNVGHPVNLSTYEDLVTTYGGGWLQGRMFPPVKSGHSAAPQEEYSYGMAAAEPTYDVPVAFNKEVEKYITYFRTKGRKNFTRWIARSGKYMPMITEILREEGLPEDLVYLAMIESGFNPRALSRAKAVGVWQFMKWTGRKYDLRVDWWIDERRDPEKATRAAARYLKDLYGMFDSWYLAAASYNGGEGRVRKAIKRYKTDNFWSLATKKRAFKRETRNYVPKYLAAMLIMKDPENYGFMGIQPIAPVPYEKVRIRQVTDIKVIAKAAGVSVKEIQDLNPELMRWFTPPEYPDYEIKIPAGTRELFEERMALVPKPERLKFLTHRVRKGETLSHIADRYGTSIRPIMYLNNLRSARFIKAGARLVVPMRADGKVYAKKKVKRKKLVRANVPDGGTYTVKRGDTLWDISRKFSVPIKRMLELNDMRKSDVLKPGQRLY
ncbi:MAG: LysM peptidoglycan-binding domain-containing protein, partial [Thermodesulfobacteriota bacterium]